MNTSDFSVVTKDIATELQGTRKGGHKAGRKLINGEVETVSEKTGQPGRFPKLKLIKGSADERQAEKTPPATAMTAEQPIVFDSLLAQMEKKILQDSNAVPEWHEPAAAPSSNPRTGREEAPAAAAVEGKPAAVGQLVTLRFGRGPQAAERSAKADAGREAPATRATTNVAPAQAKRSPAADEAPRAMGVGKMYAMLNTYLDSIQDKSSEPQATPATALAQPLAKPRLADDHASADRGTSDQDRGGDQKKPAFAQVSNSGWPVSQAPVMAGGTSSENGGTAAPLPLTQQITAAIQADASALRTASGPETGPRVITVRLSPEGLGQLAIRLEKVDGGLKVSLSAEHEATAEHLKSDSATLVTALEGLAPGFTANDLSFSSMNQKDGDTRQNANQNGPNAGIAGHEHQSQHQSHEQAAARFRSTAAPISAQGLGLEEAVGEPGRPGRRPGGIYL